MQAFLGTGVSHSIDVFPEEDLKWFGFTVRRVAAFSRIPNEAESPDDDEFPTDPCESNVVSPGNLHDYEPAFLDDLLGQRDDNCCWRVGDCTPLGAVRWQWLDRGYSGMFFSSIQTEHSNLRATGQEF